MHKLTLRPAADDDCVHLGMTLRQSDRDEVEVVSGRSPIEALRSSLKRSSHAVTAVDETGRVVCMFGVGADGFMSDEGCVWLLSSDLVEKHARLFARLSRKYLASILDLYPNLTNVVDARYTASIRWLEWLGFVVDPAEPIGCDGAMLCRFHYRGRVTIQPSSVAEVEAASNFGDLIAEYASEAAIDGMPAPAARMASYRSLEGTGMLHVYSATKGARLVGFITILAPVLPHYGVTLAVTESFFVAKAHRKGGAGLKLLRAAEAKADSLGSPGLLVSAPYGGDLAEVLPRRGYVETNRVFFKKSAQCPI